MSSPGIYPTDMYYAPAAVRETLNAVARSLEKQSGVGRAGSDSKFLIVGGEATSLRFQPILVTLSGWSDLQAPTAEPMMDVCPCPACM